MSAQDLLKQIYGCKVEDEKGVVYSVVDIRKCGLEYYIGIEAGGYVNYVSLTRYDSLISVA